MGIVSWAAVVGALLGWVSGSYSGSAFIIGGIVGAVMGQWLRSLIRQEITIAVREALADAEFSHQPEQTAQAFEGADFRSPWQRPDPAPLERMQEEEADSIPEPVEYVPTQTAEPHSHTPTEFYHQAQPDPVEEAFAKARAWLLGGNTIVRAGLVILFVGLVFLARFAANAGLFPIEIRLTVIAATGLALLLIGLRKRVDRPPFALSLQGAGVGILYLVVFAAAKAYDVLPPAAAFAFMILFATLGCALALMQNSQAMALASFLGGFAVPVLMGGKSDTPLGLFTYLTILNVAILVIAWQKSWRPLNLLGFAATFLLAGAWGFSAYEQRHFLLCEIFLAASIAIYLATAVLYAHNTPGKLGNYADSTLLFGTALAGFGLQAGLVHGHPFGEAYSALSFGAAYL